MKDVRILHKHSLQNMEVMHASGNNSMNKEFKLSDFKSCSFVHKNKGLSLLQFIYIIVNDNS